MNTFISWFPARWLAYLVLAFVLLVISWGIASLIRLLMSKVFRKNAEKLNLDPTAFYFVKNAISFVVYLLALIVLFYNIPELKSIGVALFASAGIFAAVAGFAAQSALANMVSGVMIVMFKPFRVNDHVIIGANAGVVEDITLRHTVIRNYEYRRLVIPNSIMANEVILNSNIVDDKVRLHFEIGISYDSDVKKAKLLIENAILNHPLYIDNRTNEEKRNGEPEVLVKVIGFGDSSVNIRAWIWTHNPDNAFMLKFELNELVKEAFNENGIEIPYPHRTIVYKNNSHESKI
jgi:small-conductance mechanosensitive channel